MTDEMLLYYVKKSLRMDEISEVDELLLLKIHSARELVLREVGRSDEELCALGGGEWPANLINAIVTIATEDYSNPDHSGNMDNYFRSVHALVAKYKKLV